MPNQYWTTLNSDGEMRAHVSLPEPGVGFGAGAVIIHGGWGVESGLMMLPKRLIYAGYTAIIPEMFHRDTEEQAKQGPMERIARLTWKGARSDIAAAAEYLRKEAGITRMAVIGFCMGGALAWMSGADLDFDTTVLFYPHEVFGPFGADGVVPFDLTPKLKHPVLGHFGIEDKNPNQADMQRLDEALTAQGTPHQFYSYESAGHGFALKADARTSYRPVAANVALDRTIGWFDRHLRNVAVPA
jgi:carboxymethylenebutenolidase